MAEQSKETQTGPSPATPPLHSEGRLPTSPFTWATNELRRASRDQVEAALRQIEATHRQTDVQLRPFIVLGNTDSEDSFTLRNVGHGVALRVRVDLVES